MAKRKHAGARLRRAWAWHPTGKSVWLRLTVRIMRAIIHSMRTTPSSQALFPAVRNAILAALLLQPERAWYLRDLAKHLGVTPSSLTRELSRLTNAGILQRRRDGNRVYYQADMQCPLYPELRGLMVKTAGLVDVLRDLLYPLGPGILCAFVFGSIARGEETGESDIDLMVVGDTSRFELTQPLRKAEKRLARPVNVTVYKPAEFAKRLSTGNRFLSAVLGREKLFVVGNEHDLERARKPKARRQGTHRHVGD